MKLIGTHRTCQCYVCSKHYTITKEQEQRARAEFEKRFGVPIEYFEDDTICLVCPDCLLVLEPTEGGVQ